jgi:TATA-binding protein-associated factor
MLDGLLSFSTLDIDVVLERGQPLLSSAGKEFDADLSDLDPKERLVIQKKRLKERLGLATQFMDGIFD